MLRRMFILHEKELEKAVDAVSFILIILFIIGIVNPSIAPASLFPLFEKNHVFALELKNIYEDKIPKSANFEKTKEKISKATSIENDIDRDKKAFAYLNEIRAKYGRRVIAWDENIYNLAVFRAKDMYERQYFDHLTPEGKCAEDYRAQFNVRGSIAENLYGSNAYTRPSGIDAINLWLDSRGHRYNLLYPQHIKGAIACGYGNCIFLATGDGLWGCASGKEGLEFWRKIPRQPDEI